MKSKVIVYFMIIIILTLGLVLAVFGFALTKYYYQGISHTFQKHAEAIHPLWEEENGGHLESLKDASNQVMKSYHYQDAHLQLLNNEGELIQSSTGIYEKKTYLINPSIFSYATNYQIEKLGNQGEKVLAVYTPLMLDGQVAGVLRYVSSLTKVHEVIKSLLEFGLLICLGVATIVFLFSLRLADSIVKPVNKIIGVTREMSKGRFEKRIEEEFPHELGEMARTLNEMAGEIVKAERLKNDFISSISHELRTPLTGIKGWIETMRSPEGLTEEETQLGMRMIDSESQRLIHLVEDLLDFSRYESDRVVLEPTWFEFDQLIEDVTIQLQKKAKVKKVHLMLSCTPAVIYADKDKIRQVLINLLDNAIKFSKRGTEIQIVESLKEDWVRLQVQDEGIGIKKEELSHIMNSFYKIDSKSIGAGLGLAISRNIVQKHGGTIEFESEHGKGTTVIVWLPLESRSERD